MRIYCIQLAAILAIALGMYFPGLDLLLAILYLVLIWREAGSSNLSLFQQAISGALWQLPGIFLAGSILLGLDQATDFSYYFIFMLQLWHTPVLPIINVVPIINLKDMPLYYYLMFALAPLLWMFYLIPAFTGKQAKVVLQTENN